MAGIQFVAPRLILPLFNKFTPLEGGELRAAIFHYTRSIRFPLEAASLRIDRNARPHEKKLNCEPVPVCTLKKCPFLVLTPGKGKRSGKGLRGSTRGQPVAPAHQQGKSEPDPSRSLLL
jgi:hypothetical protein